VPDEWSAALKNLEYQSQITQSGVAPLKDGEYANPQRLGQTRKRWWS